MGFTLTGVSYSDVPLHAEAPMLPLRVTAQTRNARERFDHTLNDRIRRSNHGIPPTLVHPQPLGPSLRDPLKGIGAGTVVAGGWVQYGETLEQNRLRTAEILCVAERKNGDTVAILCTREHARRIGAWVPSPEFIQPVRFTYE